MVKVQSAVGSARVRVWDLPTRLFHWALALLVVFSFVTAKIGGALTEWHPRSGYAILTLLVFRLLWGFAGSRYARFASFVRGPAAVAAYLRTGISAAGHNPLGALSVVAMLAALLVQAGTGLFATDDIASEGPLFKHVSNAAGALLTRVHRFNEKVLIALVALHVGSIAYYFIVRRTNLVMPMLTGDQLADHARAARDDPAMRLRAALLLAIAAAWVAYVVNL
jgi:cytochrome b